MTDIVDWTITIKIIAMGAISGYYRHLPGFENFVKGDKFVTTDDGIYCVKNAQYPQNQNNECKHASFIK